jgi:hypothetical protein
MSGRFGFSYTIQSTVNNINTRLNKNNLLLPPINMIRPTTLTTVNNTTYTAAAIASGMIVRSVSANAIDTMPSAVSLLTLLRGSFVGMTLRVIIRNTSAYTLTLTASATILVPYTIVVSAYRTAECIFVIESVSSGSESIKCISLM